MNRPLAVVIAALMRNNEILLIQRKRGDYIGLWGLPGGKIEGDEHVSEAARREIFEETGIESDFEEYLGFVSEHLVENGAVTEHFLLHVCALRPKTTVPSETGEGKVAWFPLQKISELKKEIIPSDILMIEHLILERGKRYYDCVLEKNGNEYSLKKFE